MNDNGLAAFFDRWFTILTTLVLALALAVGIVVVGFALLMVPHLIASAFGITVWQPAGLPDFGLMFVYVGWVLFLGTGLKAGADTFGPRGGPR